jgi:hypothetical protein
MPTLNQEMTTTPYENNIHQRPLGQLVAHLKDAARKFLRTRIEIESAMFS